jgi:Fe-S-cluster containining protein
VSYDCLKCPAYCCSYPVIALTKRDIARLARYFGIDPDTAERRFTKAAYGHKRIMRRKADPIFGRACRFLDVDSRRCTIYTARPEVCRQFPTERRCGYYDFLTFERRHQNDPELVATTDYSAWR